MQNSRQKFVTCLNCTKAIALYLENEDRMEPDAEQCYAAGNVPIPNYGWFCTQKCAIEFEGTHDVKFGRTIDGMIDYYRKENPSA